MEKIPMATPDERAPGSTPRGNSFALVGAVLAVFSAVSAFFESAVAEAVFGIVLASIALLVSLGQSPLQVAEQIRHFFYEAGRIARALVAILAIGGTFFVFDSTYQGFDLLPSWADVWVKRSAPGFVVATIVALWGSRMAHKVYSFSHTERNPTIRRLELPLYISLIALAVASMALSLGNPIEGTLPTSQGDVEIGSHWPGGVARIFRAMIALSIIWSIAFSIMILSRLRDLQRPRLAMSP
jgi:hypothetical protein